jgi:hypothetical protein
MSYDPWKSSGTFYSCIYCEYDYFPISNKWATWQDNKRTFYSNEEFIRRLKMKAFW